MKTTKLIIASTIIAALSINSYCFAGNTNAPKVARNVAAAPAPMQKVIIVGKRMTKQEKDAVKTAQKTSKANLSGAQST